MTLWELSQQAIITSLFELWERFILFLPFLLGALIIFVVGWVLAIAVGRFIERLLDLIRLNEPFERIAGLRASLERAGLDLNLPKFLGSLVKWFLYVVVLLATANVLRLDAIARFLNDVLQFLPNLLVAATILVVGVLLGNLVARVARAGIAATTLPHGGATAGIAKWAIIVFTVLAALFQIGVAGPLIQTLFTAFVAMVAIAGGLAFGLGGKDVAARILRHFEDEFAERRS